MSEGYPSEVIIHNFETTSVAYQVTVMDEATGKVICPPGQTSQCAVSIATAANETKVLDFHSAFEIALGWAPSSSQVHAILYVADPNRSGGPNAIVGQVIHNAMLDGDINMSAACALHLAGVGGSSGGSAGGGGGTTTTPKQFYSVQLNVTNTGAGGEIETVSSTDGVLSCIGEICTASAGYLAGSTVTFAVTTAANSTFQGWSGACSGTDTCSLTVNSAQSVTASFNEMSVTGQHNGNGNHGSGGTLPVPLSLGINGLLVSSAGGTPGTGTVATSDGSAGCSGMACNTTVGYTTGTALTVVATPSTNATFAGWSGACSGTAACRVVMSGMQSVNAGFARVAAPTNDIELPASIDGTTDAVIAPTYLAATGAETYLRLFDGAASPAAFTVTVVGTPSGKAYGNASYKVPKDGALQKSLSTILTDANAGPLSSGDTGYSLYISNPDAVSYYEHVVFSSITSLFENLSICRYAQRTVGLSGITFPYTVVLSVHTSALDQGKYPSQIVIHNYQSTPVTFQATVLDGGNGNGNLPAKPKHPMQRQYSRCRE
jgi:hypothetical protein